MPTSMLTRLATGAALAALVLSPLSALAQASPPAPGFAAADTDGDGAISPEEWAAMAGRMGPRARDGAGRADHAGRAAAMVRLFDADADGMLSVEEIETGLAAMADLRGHRGGMAEHGRGSGRYGDRDDMRRGDGPGRQGGRDGWGPAAMAGAFDRIDADADGAISRAEWDGAMERWSEMRGSGQRGQGAGRQ